MEVEIEDITLHNVLETNPQLVTVTLANIDNQYSISQEPTYTSDNLIGLNGYDTSEQQDLKDILNKWDLIQLYSILKEECINMERLKNMEDRHIRDMSKKYEIKIGFQIQLNLLIKALQLPEASTETSLPIDITVDFTQEPSKSEEDPALREELYLDIPTIIKSSAQGASILKLYEANNKLNEGSRSIIVETIIKHMIQQGVRMSVDVAKNISEAILQIFPTECIVYYYMKQPGKKPQGKVYDKYFNSLRQLKASGIMEKRSYSLKSDNVNKYNHSQLEDAEEDITQHLEAIFNDNCAWAELEHHWHATKNYRLHDIIKANSTEDILKKWKHYKKPLGYKLINIDFHQLHRKTGSLVLKYDVFATNIVSIFSLFIDFQNLPYISENGKSCILFYLLHSLLVPTITMVQSSNNKKIRAKYSIADSQQSFIIVGLTAGECEDELLRRKAHKMAIQPLILVTGTLFAPTGFLVYFDGIKYIINTFLEAIDICFKIFNLLNLEYPTPSYLVWRFIQNYFYELKTKYDKPNAHVECLISALS